MLHIILSLCIECYAAVERKDSETFQNKKKMSNEQKVD